MQKLFSIALLALLCACSNSNNTNNNSSNSNTTVTTPSTTVAPPSIFRSLKTSSLDLAQLEYTGEIQHKKMWQDAKGEHLMLFTIDNNQLAAWHYNEVDGQATLVQKIEDQLETCEGDKTLEFVENAFLITDIDSDDLGEVTFAYTKACLTDVSPKTLKLYVLEDGQQYHIKGNTAIYNNGEAMPVNQEKLEAFEGAPPSFLEHANTVWGVIAKQ